MLLQSTITDTVSSEATRRLPDDQQKLTSSSENNSVAAAQHHLSAALLTPWDQECGNAEYAKRLVVGLGQFANIHPFEMVNFNNPDLEYSRVRRWLICRRVAREVRASGCDLAHIQHEFCFFGRRIRESNTNFRRMIRRLRSPVVVTVHTWPWSRPLPPRKRRWLNWPALLQRLQTKKHFLRTLKRVDAVVVHSKDTYQQLINESPRWKKKTFCIPIPVEPVKHAGATPPVRKRPNEKWVVIPGFVSRYKGHMHALAALAQLPENYRLVIAGGVHPNDKTGNDYWMRLLAEADALGVQSRVIYTGFLRDPKVQAAVLHQADCFLLPYDEVGQSGSAVLADALAHLRPVVTSTAKSMFVYRGTLDTVTSSVAVDVTDPDLLANALVDCIESDPPRNPLMPSHQQAVAKTYSMDRTREQYRQVYTFAVSKGRKP